MNQHKKLKPCPFCNAEAVLEDCRTIWRVLCTNAECEAVMLGKRAPEPEDEEHCKNIDWHYFEQTAVDRWNRRPTQ